MFESLLGDLFDEDKWESISDWASGYTSANAANRFYAENMDKQQEYNLKNMEIEQDYNLANMAKTDEYQRKMMMDSPSLQVAALRRAGLNPLLAVNNGISSAQTAVSATTPRSASPSASMPNVEDKIGTVLSGLSTVATLGSTVSDIVLKNAQTKAASAQAAESEARTLKTQLESESIDPEVERLRRKYPGKFGEGAISIKHGVTDPLFSLLNSAWSATKDWAVNDIKATGRQLKDGADWIKSKFPKEDSNIRFFNSPLR